MQKWSKISFNIVTFFDSIFVLLKGAVNILRTQIGVVLACSLDPRTVIWLFSFLGAVPFVWERLWRCVAVLAASRVAVLVFSDLRAVLSDERGGSVT